MAPFFGNLNRIEKLSEIKAPLKTPQLPIEISWPLQKDGLFLAFLALQVIFATFCHYCGFFEFGEIVTATNSKKIRASPKPMSNTDLMKTTCYGKIEFMIN